MDWNGLDMIGKDWNGMDEMGWIKWGGLEQDGLD